MACHKRLLFSVVYKAQARTLPCWEYKLRHNRKILQHDLIWLTMRRHIYSPDVQYTDVIFFLKCGMVLETELSARVGHGENDQDGRI